MKLTFRNCLHLTGSLFVLYLLIHCWDAVLQVLGTVFSAAAPIWIGLIAAYIVNILMRFYERHYFMKRADYKWVQKTKRPVCMVAAFVTLIGIVALIIGLVWPNFVSCIQALPEQLPPLTERLLANEIVPDNLPRDLLVQLSEFDWEIYLSKAMNVLMRGVTNAAQMVMQTVSDVISKVVTAFLSLIFTVYFLLCKDDLIRQTRKLMQTYLPTKWYQRLLYAGSVCNDSFSRYIIGQCTEAVILGTLCALGMVIFAFPYAGMIGALVGFTALIPVAGAYIGAIVGAIMMLTVSPVKAVLFIVFILVLQQIEGNLIYPKVVGNSIGLPAVWVLAAVIVGGGLSGIAGMLVGVPLTAAIYRLIREDIQRRNGRKNVEKASDETA